MILRIFQHLGSKYGTTFPLGIHRSTFTGFLSNCYLRIVLPVSFDNKTVHSRSIATSQYNEVRLVIVLSCFVN